MKVCQNCEMEHDGKDGENLCPVCEAAETKAELRSQRRRSQAKARREAYESCGLVRVRGALGGVYWE